MQSVEQSGVAGHAFGYEVWQPPGREALEALDHLWERIFKELNDYVSYVREMQDQERQERAGWTRNWLETEGVQVRLALACRIRRSKSYEQDKMRVSIQASLNLAEIARERDLTKAEHWDLILSWAEDVLPSVEDAFELFAEQTREDPEDASEGASWQTGLSEDLRILGDQKPSREVWEVPDTDANPRRFDDVAA